MNTENSQEKDHLPITDEQKQLVVNSYEKTFDKPMAYLKAGLTNLQCSELDKDEVFQARLTFFVIQQREEIIKNYKKFMTSTNEQIAFKATTDFAKLIYPDFFNNLKDKDKQVDVNVNVKNCNSPEENKRIEEEFGALVGDVERFKSDKKSK